MQGRGERRFGGEKRAKQRFFKKIGFKKKKALTTYGQGDKVINCIIMENMPFSHGNGIVTHCREKRKWIFQKNCQNPHVRCLSDEKTEKRRTFSPGPYAAGNANI
jgi:hypothetical protein